MKTISLTFRFKDMAKKEKELIKAGGYAAVGTLAGLAAYGIWKALKK